MNKKQYVTALDPIRFFAALAVVCYHYMYHDVPNLHLWVSVTQFGYLGVPLFFMISGFVISMSIHGASSPLNFLIHRAVRLYPAFIACSLVTVLYVAIFAHQSAYSSREVLLNMTMFAGWLRVRLINGAYWSLAVEWIFYFMAAASFAILGRAKFHWFLWAWGAVALLNIFVHLGFLGKPFILGAAPLFIAGAALYMVMTRQHTRQMWVLFVASLPIALHWAVMDAQHLDLPAAQPGVTAVGITLSFYVLMAAVAYFSRDNGRESKRPHKLLRAAGAVSYPLYLIHETIGQHILIKWFPSGGLVFLAGLIVVMVVLSWLIAEYYEKPTGRWLRHKLSAPQVAKIDTHVVKEHSAGQQIQPPPDAST